MESPNTPTAVKSSFYPLADRSLPAQQYRELIASEYRLRLATTENYKDRNADYSGRERRAIHVLASEPDKKTRVQIADHTWRELAVARVNDELSVINIRNLGLSKADQLEEGDRR